MNAFYKPQEKETIGHLFSDDRAILSLAIHKPDKLEQKWKLWQSNTHNKQLSALSLNSAPSL